MGSQFDEGVEHLLHAEVVDGAAEEDRGLGPGQVALHGKGVAGAFQQLQVAAQVLGLQAQQLVELGVVHVVDDHALLDAAAVGGREEVDLLLVDGVGALEALAHADGPAQGGALDAQVFLDVGQHVQGVQAVAVELVDEGHDGRVAHAADVHELAGLGLDALGAVDDQQGGVHGRQDAVGVLGEVLVARRVQEVHVVAVVLELHDRGGHGDAALLLHLHPVRGGVAGRLARLDRAGHVDGAAEEQELLRQGRLARVRVADDAEGPAFFHVLSNFSCKCAHESLPMQSGPVQGQGGSRRDIGNSQGRPNPFKL